MAKLILKFNAGGQCDLCGGRTTGNPAKDRKIMLTEGSCILFNICLDCIIKNQIMGIKEDDSREVEIEKEYLDFVIKY